MNLTVERIRELLDYNPETGFFTWRRRVVRRGYESADKSWNLRFDGKQVAVRISGKRYAYIGLFCKNYIAHRLAWSHFYGEHPSSNVDHINGNPSDNRIANLRLATQSQNLMNARLRSDNTTGHKGVYFHKQMNKWGAHICKDGKTRSLGLYFTKEEAILARQKAEEKLYGEFSHLNRAQAGQDLITS